MSQTITRRIETDTGHRLMRHEGKCRNMHGHRYVFLITCTVPELGPDGMVLDFSIIKDRVGAWLDANFDHATILQDGDPWIKAFGRVARESDDFRDHSRLCILPVAPTAENLAKEVYNQAVRLLPEVTVVSVTCQETPNCESTYKP